MQYNKVVLALGSNLGDKKAFLLQAIEKIHNHIGFVAQTSALYETPSWGFDSFPFYNMCILIHTHFDAELLLTKLKEIEKNLGRTEKTIESYAARTVDIDLIYFNDEIIETEGLTLPHPQLQHRKFVLVPLNDLSFEWKHPVFQKTTNELLQSCTDDSEIKKVEHIVLPKDSFVFSRINFLAVEGNIGSGKTTLVQKITQDFNAKPILERFADNPFLPKFYEQPERYAFPLEMSFLADRYSQLNDDLAQYDLFNEFAVADYYIYKSLIFAQITLDQDEAALYRTVFEMMYKEIQKPDLYVYLYQKTDALLLNIQKRGRNYEKSISADYLNKISFGYNEFIKTLPKEKVLIIDVTNKDFVENHEDYLEVLQIINRKILSAANG
ncbi:MAG TPA: 2-amino-4-hydroxy-6-hydroxymethyldihydropteridine diphosphokinase [Flavobacterium sp.]|nr:2-amino-4-hydroxy-6-hydroxymethyldihydropteridine diphosphokinase [Flavobacterium sp.]